MNYKSKRDQRFKKAHDEAFKSIVKELGKGADREEVIAVVLTMAHWAITDCGQLTIIESEHNAKVFTNNLANLIAETQKGVNTNGGYSGRLM